MTPEETKEHVERRLSELGWNVHIGRTGYEKIFRATGGAEIETNRICHELIAVGAEGASRDITDAVVDLAVADPDRQEEQRPRARANGAQETERASIDRLAATLEAKLREEGARERPQPFAGAALRAAGKGAAQAASAGARAPKVLIVQSSREARARTAGALSRDFRVVEAPDGERAWATLLEQPDIELVVIDRALAETNGHSLTRRIRAATSPPHLSALPVLVIGGPDDGDMRPAVLRAGASEFLPHDADARTLRARAVNLRTANGKAAGRARAQAGERPVRRAADVLIVEPRYPKASLRGSRRRVSSTMTITLSATLLLALAIGAAFYLSRNPQALGLRAAGTTATGQPHGASPAIADQGSTAEKHGASRDAAREQGPPDERERPAAMSAGPAGNAGPRAGIEGRDPSSTRTPDATNPANAAAGGASEFNDETTRRIARAQESLPRDSSAGESTPGTAEAPAATSERPHAPLQESAPRQAPSPGGATGASTPWEALERAAPGVSTDADTDSGATGIAGANDDRSAPAGERAPENSSSREPPASAASDPPATTGSQAPRRTPSTTGEAAGNESAGAPTAPLPAGRGIERPDAPDTAGASGPGPGAPQPEATEQSAPASAEQSAPVRERADIPNAQATPAPRAAEQRGPAGVERLATRERDSGGSPAAQPAPAPRTEIAAARPPRAAASPIPSEPADHISRDELVSLVQRFASVYEAGDLAQFLSLFAEDARTNDRVGREGIRRDYEALFRSTDLRNMNLGELNWEVNGDQAYGWGEFDVTVRRHSDREEFVYTGSLTFVVEKVDGRLRIVRLFHGQQRVNS